MSGQIFGIDFDGTIADTNLQKSRWIKNQLGKIIQPWNCDRTSCEPEIGTQKYNEMVKDVYSYDWTLHTPEVSGVREALSVLHKNGMIYIVTARPVEKLVSLKDWLAQHSLDGFVQKVLTARGTSKKRLCFENHINVLIDDDVRHLKDVTSENLHCILFKHWLDGGLETPSHITLCRSWEEVLSQLNFTIH